METGGASNAKAKSFTPEAESSTNLGLVISSRIVCRLVMVARDRGVDVDSLLQAVGIDRAVLDDVDGMVPSERYLALWTQCVERTDAVFPLDVARQAHETHNILRSVCGTCATVGEGLARASQYLRVLTNSVRWSLEPGEHTVALVVERSRWLPEHRVTDEFALCEIVQAARVFSHAEWRPQAVHFRHPAHEGAAALREFFAAPVHFSSSRAELAISLASLAVPLRQADPVAMAYFQADAEHWLEEENKLGPLGREVGNVVRSALVTDGVSVDRVAKRFGMSSRTLRRRLAAESISFQEIVDRARCSLAKHHVGERKLATSEIAFLLGFSEASAFHRAFRRWTAMTPGEYAALTRRPSAG